MELIYHQVPAQVQPYVADKVSSFIIPKDFLSENYNLLVTETEIVKVKTINNFPRFLIYGTKDFNKFVALSLIENKSFENFIPNYAKIWNSISPTLSLIDWKPCLPQKKFAVLLNEFVEFWKANLIGQKVSYFLNVFVPTEQVFDSLVFDIEYNRIKTQTGRMKVLSGMNVLTFTKEQKQNALKEYNFSYSLDYSSLEPSFLLSYAKQNFWDDNLNSKLKEFLSQNKSFSVYGFIDFYLKTYKNINFVPLVLIKPVLISLIYGAGKETVLRNFQIRKTENNLSFPIDDLEIMDNIVSIIDEIFFLKEIKQKIQTDWIENNHKFIHNFYGRKIATPSNFEDYKLISFFSQSSSVDVCMLGFLKIINQLKKPFKAHLKPCFLIHDSIVVSSNREALNELTELSKLGCIDVPGIAREFLNLKVEKI